MTYGIDVSHWQRSAMMPWDEIAKTASFCICRTNYGSETRDREVANHVSNARRRGMRVGVYAFFRPHQEVAAQFALFKSVVNDVGACRPGDIVPFVDIEKDPVPAPGVEVTPAWSEPARELVERIANEYGDCGVYLTAREFKFLGSPAWALERPLWVAHYRHADPDSPGGITPHIHQHRVGPYVYNGHGGVFQSGTFVIDQNRALKPLPLLREYAPEPTPLPLPEVELPPLPSWIGDPNLGLPDEAYDEMSEGRRKHNLDDK